MSAWNDVAHFMYGRGFWYANPQNELKGLIEEQLYWVPSPKALCILWQVGHIAHREQFHIGRFLLGQERPAIPPQYEVFGPEWASAGAVRRSIDSVQAVLDWALEVRETTHDFTGRSLSSDL